MLKQHIHNLRKQELPVGLEADPSSVYPADYHEASTHSLLDWGLEVETQMPFSKLLLGS
jgi:hypothetical protein